MKPWNQVDPEAVRRFVREDVQDLQPSYRPEDMPEWTRGAAGRMAFQFGDWSYNAARMLGREIFAPMAQAARDGDWPLFATHFTRLLGVAATQVVAQELSRDVQQLFGRRSDVANMGEILKAMNDRNPEALGMIVNRLGQDLIGGPLIGLFGDAIQGGMAVAGRADTTHTFNPLMPAGLAYLGAFKDLLTNYLHQGGKLSNEQWAHFFGGQFSGGREAVNLANTMGVHLPGQSQASGLREKQFAQSRLDLFYSLHPDFDNRPKGAVAFATNIRTPYYQNLSDALYGGDAKAARAAVIELQKSSGLTPAALKKISDSISGERTPHPNWNNE